MRLTKRIKLSKDGWDKLNEWSLKTKKNLWSHFNLVVSFSQTSGAARMVEIFNSSSSFEEAIDKVKSSQTYISAKKIFDEEFKNIKFSRKSYPDIKLNIYWVNTRFKHMRVFVDYITFLNLGTNIFILNEITKFKFSFRTSLDINFVEIIREISKENLDFSGGGHPKACGAMLFNENVEELLDVFIKKYKKAIEQ